MTDLCEDDLRIDVYSNISGCAVRVTHLPTGMVASSAPQESRVRARAEALAALRDKLAQGSTEGDVMAVTIDTIRIIPERGPERVMVVSHVEHYLITLNDPDASETTGAPA